ncbi:unnamed protein product [Trifolium pratense]|uniref:Uncharacterized protein n=1 Tax=Trifolium pratense TaxID=57577 RepID=A0ACB0L033_TRIPR|nr:unnamed protein product [Trifolium pratense]
MRIPACHLITNQCDHWPLIRFVKWPRQEQHYVGRGMYERSLDFIKFWLVILTAKFSFAYFLPSESDAQKRDEYIHRLMQLPNQKWMEIIS